MNWRNYLPNNIREKFEYYNVNNAVEIMATAFPDEWKDICNALDVFFVTKAEMIKGGGSESAIPRKIASALRPKKWHEVRISGDLNVKIENATINNASSFLYDNYLYGYFIDYVKNKVAFDMEWNSKDQTFDRDLTSFRAFYETGVINVASIMTRSVRLTPIFHELGIHQKYGASTTWMGKLLPRVKARRQDGCPLLIIGITPDCIKPDHYIPPDSQIVAARISGDEVSTETDVPDGNILREQE